MAAKSELEMREILLTTGQVQPIKVESKGGHVSAVCRQLPGQEKAWLKSVDAMLHLGIEHNIPFHICRQYFLKDGKMVYGWHVSIEAKSAKDLDAHLGLFRDLASSFEMDLTPVGPPPPTSPPAEPDSDPDPVLAKDAASRQAAYQARTSAAPRPAAPVDRALPEAPADYNPNPRVVYRGSAKDSKNRIVPVIIEEFSLPHVFTNDMNKPNEKGRGAKTI